jgi:hypothetical protein
MSTGRLEFLIVGTARSGTTLVQRLCCELPDVWVPPETHFWPLAADAAERFDFPLQGRNRIEMVAWLLDSLSSRTLPVRPAEVTDEIGKRDRRASLWVVFESLVAAMSPPVPVLGEKTPGHVAHWEQLTSAIPELKLIGVIRDPHAVLRSHRKVPWGDHDPWTLAERWLAHQRSLEDAARLLGPSRAMLIRYEDLVIDPDAHQAAIADFLAVPNEPVPLDPALLRDHPLFPEREVWKSNALDSVTTAHTSEWSAELSDADLAVIDAMLGPALGHHGYERSTARTTPPSMDDRARSSVMAFRTWYAQTTATTGLPIT